MSSVISMSCSMIQRVTGFWFTLSRRRDEKGVVITGGHFRVPVSADGSVAGQIDLLSQLTHQSADPGHTLAAIAATQSAGKLPVETWIYSSDLYNSRCTSQ